MANSKCNGRVIWHDKKQYNYAYKNIFIEGELEEKSVSKDSLINALSMHAMTMKDWTNELDSFLKMTKKDILSGKGTVSHEKALEKAHKEYDKYMETHLTKAEKDYLRVLGEDVKKLK